MKTCWKTPVFYCLTILTLLVCVQMYSKTVTIFAQNDAAAQETCVVIDPGHGGEDGGAISCSGLSESAYNLEISKRLNDLLNIMGYKTKMIRETDISVYTKGETMAQKKVSDLKQRVKFVNETPNAILLSIHQNYFGDSKYSGAQVFFAKTADSDKLAEELQGKLVANLNKGSRRRSKMSTGVYLMEHINCPAVLVECGFLSNENEERLLRSADYQKKLVSVIAATVSQYVSNT